jgi:Transposase C of IS166 homeodomain
MDAASGELADLEGLSVAQLKAMLREQHAALQEKHAQLAVQDALLRSYTVEIEALKLQILKLRRMQFGNRSEKRAQEIEQLELWVAQLEEAVTQRSSVLVEQAGLRRGASFPRISRAKRRRSPRRNHAALIVAANSNIWAKTFARCSNSSQCALK